MEPRKFEYIDCLRGIAILLVLAIHNGQHGLQLGEAMPLVDKFRFAGRYGVQLFFIVSAYTLMLSHQSRQQEENGLRNFFIRRGFRILPMYYLALAFYSLDSLFIAPNFSVWENIKDITSPEMLKNIFFLNNFYPNMPYYVPGGWSVVAEISFYLLLPLMCKYAKNMTKTSILLFGAIVISFGFTALAGGLYPDSNSLYISFPNQLPVFILGMLLFFLINREIQLTDKWLLVGLAAAMLLYLVFIPDENVGDCLKASLLLFLFAFLICKKQYKIIVNPFFSFVGKISFSMYLIHFGVLYWMTRLNFIDFLPASSKWMYLGNYIVRYIIMFTITAGLSYLTYQYIEKYFIRKGRDIIKKISRS